MRVNITTLLDKMREALLTIRTGIIRWPSRTLGGLTSGTGGDFNSSQSEPLFFKCRGAARYTAVFLVTPPGCWM